jgi:hypothetical protein
MARQRTVKPGFFSNEDLAACAPLTRIFFEGLWCWADREGRLADRPRRLKAEILPYDDADGEAMVAELAERGFLVRYEHGGVRLLQIVNFLKHQSPHPREVPSVLPDPDEVMPRQDPGTNKDKPSRGKPRKGTEEQRTSNAGVSGVSGKEEHAACARDGAAEQPESPGAGGGHRTGPQEGAAEANAASGGESPAASDGEGAPGAADCPDNGPRRTDAPDDEPHRALVLVDEICALPAVPSWPWLAKFRVALAERLTVDPSWFRIASPDDVENVRDQLERELARIRDTARAVEIALVVALREKKKTRKWPQYLKLYRGPLSEFLGGEPAAPVQPDAPPAFAAMVRHAAETIASEPFRRDLAALKAEQDGDVLRLAPADEHHELRMRDLYGDALADLATAAAPGVRVEIGRTA